jgi:PAT family beta-lactamase induction signal transducer AmpG
MFLLWLLWSKGYVVQSVRQTSTDDDGEPVRTIPEQETAPPRPA